MMTFLFRMQFPILLFCATYLSLTGTPGAVFEPYSDKFLHLLCWCVLFISLRLALLGKARLVASALGLLAYATALEALQLLSPGRYFSTLDMFANALGIAIGLCLWQLYCHFSQAK